MCITENLQSEVCNMCQTDWQLFILVLLEKAFIWLSNEGSYVSKLFFKEKLLAFFVNNTTFVIQGGKSINFIEFWCIISVIPVNISTLYQRCFNVASMLGKALSNPVSGQGWLWICKQINSFYSHKYLKKFKAFLLIYLQRNY